jgi:DNA primase
MAMTQWLDFETVKHRVPITAVLDHYRIQDLRPSGSDHLRGRCPLHSGDGRETFHVDTAEQVFHCFSCQAGGSVLDLVMAIEGCGLRQSAERILSWSAARATEVAPWSPIKATVTKKREFTAALPFRLRGIDLHHPYLRLRGIDEATAAEFGIGFYGGPGLMHNRLVIPIENQFGALVGYCGRALDGSEPRYRFPPRFSKSQFLFNFHRATARNTPEVIVVEGFFDCLKVHQAGFLCVIAIMGSALSQQQLHILVHSFQRIRLMLDGDAAGRRASAVIATRLAQHAPVEVIQLPDATQPDQLSASQIRELLNRRITN